MGSRDPFNIASSPTIAPIVCSQCGNNMHCIRRRPVARGEQQSFVCAWCAFSLERTVGLQDSNAAFQAEAEKRLGIHRGQS